MVTSCAAPMSLTVTRLQPHLRLRLCLAPGFQDGAFVDDTDVGLFAFQQSVGNSFEGDLAPDGVDPFVIDIARTAMMSSRQIFVIDIAAAAEALAGSGATQAQKIEAQLWFTRNIGVEPAEDVDGEVVYGVAVTTRDR